MKKALFIGISCLLLVSCTKEWSCNCVTVTTAHEEYGGDTVTKNDSYTIKGGKKKEAESTCQDKEVNEQYPDGVLKSVVKTCETVAK